MSAVRKKHQISYDACVSLQKKSLLIKRSVVVEDHIEVNSRRNIIVSIETIQM